MRSQLESKKRARKASSMPEMWIPLLEHPIQKKTEGPAIKMTMNKLLPILILLLFATATASATTLHGTMLDADTGAEVGGVKVHLYDSTSTAWTDSGGKFDITIPKDAGGQISFESESPCYCVETSYNPPSGVEGYYPDTDELWVLFRMPSCSSGSDPSTGVDPDHPGPGHDPLNDTTPRGMAATSTAGWWGAGLIGAVWTTAVLALTVIVGAVALPSLAVIAGFALFGALVCMLIFPAITSANISLLSWITGSAQDAGNAVWNAFGFHFNTTDSKTFGEAAGDGVATVVKTVTDAFTRVFVDAAREATGLSESMIWLLTGAAIILGLLLLYSRRQKLHILPDLQKRVMGKK